MKTIFTLAFILIALSCEKPNTIARTVVDSSISDGSRMPESSPTSAKSNPVDAGDAIGGIISEAFRLELNGQLGGIKDGDCPDYAKEKQVAQQEGNLAGFLGIRGARRISEEETRFLDEAAFCSTNDECVAIEEKCNCAFFVNKKAEERARKILKKVSCEKPACCGAVIRTRCLENRCGNLR